MILSTFPSLFADLEILDVQQADEHITIITKTNAPSAVCPDCKRPSHRHHSSYTRHLRHLPCFGRSVELHIQVKRLRCEHTDCPRRTFVEPLTSIARRHARRTVSFTQGLQDLGLALGGEAGARLGNKLGLPISGDTILRVLHALPTPHFESPKVLGIDDFAWRKGVNYGVILCDLERGRPIDLLPELDKEAVINWLQKHPQLKIISRDRSRLFADAADQGAPQAQQVTDRWHLLKNMKDAAMQVLRRHRKQLPFKEKPGVSSSRRPFQPPDFPNTKRGRASRQSREQRIEKYRQVQHLSAKGMSQSAIAKHLGITSKTVNVYLQSEVFPERKPQPVGSKALHPYLPYIHRRWGEGCHNASQLWREISTQGYDRSRNSVLSYVARLRQGLPTAAKEHSAVQPRRRRYSAHEATRLLLRHPVNLNKTQQQHIQEMCAIHPDVETLHSLAHRFIRMVCESKPEEFGPWMKAALASSLTPMQTLAMGLHRDRDAVLAALSLPWSNGPVEGHVTRLKLLKRQMYGRASFKLLRTRLLYPP